MRDDNGNIVSYMPVHVLKDGLDGREYGAQPTAASYHYQITNDMAADITKRYVDTMFLVSGNYRTYFDYDYSKSYVLHNGILSGQAWSMTSPYTGNVYENILPFTAFLTADGTQYYLFFVEIYNDYQAYRSYAPYDPAIDGSPRHEWVGVVLENDAFFDKDSTPPDVRTILPKPYTYTDTTAQPPATVQKYVRYHFRYADLPDFTTAYTPSRPASHFMYGNQERDIEVAPMPDPAVPEYPDSVGYPRARGISTTVYSAADAAKQTTWSAMGWDIVADGTPLQMSDGSSLTPYRNTTDYSVGGKVLWSSNNGKGYIVRANSNSTYDFWWNTFDFDAPGRAVGVASTAITYYSRYVVKVPGSENYNSQTVWTWSGNPYTFIGVAWDGGTVTANGNTVTGSMSNMQNALGCVSLSSDYFVRTAVCNSNSLPSNPANLPNEFNGVLSVANANVFACTGRHQCVFVWYAKEGFIRYHCFW